MMQVTIELPDEFAQRLQARWQETPAHIARELVVLEAYREGVLIIAPATFGHSK